jgi:hypothetical protein
VNRQPPPTNIGEENCAALSAFVDSIDAVIGVFESELPVVARGQRQCLPFLRTGIATIRTAMTKVTAQVNASEQTTTALVTQFVKEQAASQQFMTAADRLQFEQTKTETALRAADWQVVERVLTGMSATAAKRLQNALDVIRVAKGGLERAQFDAQFPDEVDDAFVRQAGVLTATLLGQPLRKRMSFLRGLYESALRADREDKQLLLEYSGRPIATEVAAGGVVKLKGQHHAAAFATGQASSEVQDAVWFLNTSADRINERRRSSALGMAAECQKMIEHAWVKIFGLDPSDPASVGKNAMESMYSGSKPFQLGSLTPDVDASTGNPRWLARYLKSGKLVRFLPWQTVDPDDLTIKPRARGAT